MNAGLLVLLDCRPIAHGGSVERPDTAGGETARLLLKHWKEYTPALRSAALDGLLTRPDRAALLLDAIESKLPNPAPRGE